MVNNDDPPPQTIRREHGRLTKNKHGPTEDTGDVPGPLLSRPGRATPRIPNFSMYESSFAGFFLFPFFSFKKVLFDIWMNFGEER